MESFSDVLIVFIVFAAIFGSGMLKIVLNHREKIKDIEATQSNSEQSAENRKLHDQVEKLNQRVIVLEKIVTTGNYDLKNEINSL
jgi:cell division protein FtsB